MLPPLPMKEALYRGCSKFHRNQRLSKTHTILKTEELPSKQDIVLHFNSSFNCIKHAHIPVKLYCKIHANRLCSECFIADHSNCPDVVQVINETSSLLETLGQVKKQINDVEDKLRRFTMINDSNLRQLESNVNDLTCEIRALKKSMNDVLDELEKRVRLEGEKIMSKERTRMEHINQSYKSMIMPVRNLNTILESVKEFSTQTQLSMLVTTLLNQISLSKARLEEEYSNGEILTLNMEINPLFKSVLSLLRDAIARLDMKGNDGNVIISNCLKPLKELRAERVDIIDVKATDDKMVPCQDEMIVSGPCGDNKTYYLSLISTEGNEISFYEFDGEGSGQTSINLNALKTRLYICVYSDNSLRCFGFYGTKYFTFKHRDLQEPQGVALDRNDNVYVTGSIVNSLWSMRQVAKRPDGTNKSITSKTRASDISSYYNLSTRKPVRGATKVIRYESFHRKHNKLWTKQKLIMVTASEDCIASDEMKESELNVSEDLNCSICLKVFRSPRRLPCWHLFCHDCLQSHISSTTSVQGTLNEFCCPICGNVASLETDVSRDKWSYLFPLDTLLLSALMKAKMKVDLVCNVFQAEDVTSPAHELCILINEAPNLLEILGQVKEQINDVEDQLQRLTKINELNLSKLESQVNCLTCEIQEIKKSMNDILCDLEKRVRMEGEKILNEERKRMERRNQNCKSLIMPIRNLNVIVKSMEKCLTQTQLFLLAKTMSSQISLSKDTIVKEFLNTEELTLHLEFNPLLQSIFSIARGDIAKLKMKRNDGNMIISNGFKPLKDCRAETVDVIDVKRPDDNGVPWYTDVCYVSKDEIVLIDRENNQCSLLNSSVNYITSFALSPFPSKICVVNENEVAVSKPGQKAIVFINSG
ncbi:hypothetical protein CHS0354_016816 [Potamilus streckersoni]|uniref:RING-type domain-containing protein n=1 Tax=Potamilus streckersoni TaxID=2493646 RepID=A0AAE0W679_9BIVA|nr:hypothetical protein CHS0354_016816 [Potamilus streckersoni]